MTSESKTWDTLKTEYLRQVEKALSSVKHPRRKEVLEDVRSHLDRRFAELEPQQQTWESFQAIITQMGPASDYAELLDADATVPGRGIWQKYLWWLGLAAIVVIAAILLPMARPDNNASYIVTFEPAAPFAPQTARELLDAFNENHPEGVRTHHFRTGIHGGKLQGRIVVDTATGKQALVDMIGRSDKLTLVAARAVTQDDLETHFALSQLSLTPDQAKEVCIVIFKPVSPFVPVTARGLLAAFNENHPRGVRTHHYRTQVKDKTLTGRICVDTKTGMDAVVSMIDKSEKLMLVEATLATEQDLEKLYKMGQPSLSSAAAPEEYRALPESPNRKLLDEQTVKQLRRHEQFSAGWFKVEEAYEAASESEKSKMVQRWIADAVSDDFDKATRAIAALGNVAARGALDVLISIGQKPKNGNRPRWMAARALGRIGDVKAAPLLINILDHYNMDTRLYAKVALCEITGVYFRDSIQEWTMWAQANGIEVKPMDVGPKNMPTSRQRTSRTRPATSRNKTVSRSGKWPEGKSSIRGGVFRQARWSRIGHGKVCLSSEEFGSWVVEMEDHGDFDFSYIPAGVYELRTIETFGYQETHYNPENKPLEEPTFELGESERKSVNIEIKPSRPYRRIAGRILGEDGKPATNTEGLGVNAWVRKPQGRWKGYYRRVSSSGLNKDGSYLLEGLDGRPVYVQVRDGGAPDKDNPYPPHFYPGAFSRTAAKLVTFGDDDVVENTDIPMTKTGGLVLEGLVTNESTGAPVPEALVSIFHFDMFFDLFYAYTDDQGQYRIGGLGEGKFIVHVDAVHKGLVKTRKLVTIKSNAQETQLNFNLRRGVAIGGEFVDQDGKPWQVGRSSGNGRSEGRSFGGAASNFRYGNRYAPAYIRNGSTVFYEEGQGDGLGVMMVFPTESSFLLPAMVPGKTVINFTPGGRGERVRKILYQDKDIRNTGLVTESGQEIKDITIVIGTSERQ